MGGAKLRRGAAALALVAALGMTACGSDDDDGGGGGGASNGATSGEPIKIAVIADVTSQTGVAYPGIPPMIERAAEEVNAAGGIDGRPIEITECDLQNLPDQAVRCARQAVEDGVAAALVQVAFGAAKVPPIFEEAGIPYLPAFAFEAADMQSEVSYPMVPGVLTQIAASYLAGQHCENPVLLTFESPSLDYTKELSSMGFAAAGKEPAKVVAAPLDTKDWAPIAAEVTADDPDCVVPYINEALTLAFYPALQQTGFDGKLVGYQGGVYTEKTLNEFPDLLEGALAVDMSYPFDHEQWDDYNETMAGLEEEYPAFTSSLVKGSYLNFLAVVDAARRAAEDGKDVTGETMLETFASTTDIDTGGLLAPVDTSTEWDVERFPRMFNTSVLVEEIKDGQVTLIEDGEFQDLGDEIAAVANQ
ncbi:MAG: ABC transporter substrate-binding protein [Solirubrobacterales bacterium]|nr:ABC transporter substrate-binding protein [Solirubrobacterales bacterium]